MKKIMIFASGLLLLGLTACGGKAGKPAEAAGEAVENVAEVAADEAAAPAEEADDAPRFLDLEEPDADGQLHKLSEYVGNGQWVLIDFWASWCGPCRAEMPNVVAAYDKYHDKGFNVVGLSFDENREDWLQAVSTLNLKWTHLSDLKGWNSLAAEVYGIRSIPSSLLVDPEGRIVASDLRGEMLQEALAEIFD